MEEETKKMIDEAVAKALASKPEVEGENKAAQTAVVEVTSNPEDRLLAEPKGEWSRPYEFYLDVVRAGSNHITEKLAKWHEASMRVEKAATTGHMEESELATGGYLVPEEFMAKIEVKRLENSIVRPRATKIPMSATTIRIPVVDVSSHASNFFGGVTIYRPDEAGTITASRPKFARVELNLHKIAGLVYVTSELLSDSPISVEPLLTDMFGMAAGATEDWDYLRGTGSNEPMGAFHTNNPSLISCTRTTSSQINWDDIVNMWARLHPSCHANAVWLAAIDCFPQLATMSMPVGTGGVPVWLPANAGSASPYGTLLGKPLILTEKMNTMGTTPDIGLVDFTQYWIAQKAGGNLKMASSMHVSFTTDETAFRFTMRYDGQPSWRSALTPQNSGDTLSPFVTVAT
jgi:HK97 family phage major capsid protein